MSSGGGIINVNNTGSSGGGGSGPNVIQGSDFFVKDGILHPIVVGSIAIFCLFAYLRVGSNRCIAPLNIFDWVINVALGSTLAGIVNGTALVRGLIALATMLAFQWITSFLGSNFHGRFSWIFQGPPLLICFRGKMLMEVIKRHRISPLDVQASMRQSGILNICQVECAIIEPNGNISIFTKKTLEDAKVDPEVLMAVPAYRALCEEIDEKDSKDQSEAREGKGRSSSEAVGDEEANEIAGELA